MNRREALKLFAFVPVAAALPAALLHIPKHGGWLEFVTAFEAYGEAKRSMPGTAILRRVGSEAALLHCPLNAYGGIVHWYCRPEDAIIVTPKHPVEVWTSIPQIKARALLWDGHQEYRVIES